MNKKDITDLHTLYESAVFVARAEDLSMGQESEDECGDQGDIEIALSDLKKLHEYSKKLWEMIKSKPDVDGWMQSKITKAADYVSEVFHRMDSADSDEMCCDHNDDDV